jgi:ketosteroid isomerase-like protein
MSRENVETMRAAYAAWNRDDLDAVLRIIHQDLVWEEDSQISGVGLDSIYRGPGGYLKRQRDAFGIWHQMRTEDEEYLDAGEHVVVSFRAVARTRQSNVEIEMPLVEAFTLRNGKIIRRRVYRDRAAALRAVGLAR